jgi:hypothetical protein
MSKKATKIKKQRQEDTMKVETTASNAAIQIILRTSINIKE